MPNYILLENDAINGLEFLVNQKITQGYLPIGGMTFLIIPNTNPPQPRFFQAMVIKAVL